MADDEMLAVLKEIRDLQKQQLDTQHKYTWVLLPIFVILAIMAILGLTGFFVP
jgi:hypothetical protein